MPVEFNPAAAEGVTHPESLRQKDRNARNTLESAVAVVIKTSETATEGAAADTSP